MNKSNDSFIWDSDFHAVVCAGKLQNKVGSKTIKVNLRIQSE